MKIAYFFLGCLLLASCSNPNQMKLKGSVEGLKKGTLLLQKYEDTVLVSIDSMTVDGVSDFEFSTEVISPEVFYLTLRFNDSIKNEKSIAVFGEPKEITIESKLENFEIENSVSGSINHEQWDIYKKLMKRYNDQNLILIEKGLNALKDNNDSLRMDIERRQEKLVRGAYLATINFAKNQKELELAPYLMLTEAFDANLRYHDTIYGQLPQKIKDSKYGMQLKSFIDARKESEN